VSLVSGPGSYAVPSSLDVSTHRIVDISLEPRDGEDAHFGRSILRGTLTEARPADPDGRHTLLEQHLFAWGEGVRYGSRP
jgi:hypothetical protein